MPRRRPPADPPQAANRQPGPAGHRRANDERRAPEPRRRLPAAAPPAVGGEPLVRCELLDQDLPDQLVAEPVPVTRDHHHIGAEGGVEQPERLVLGHPRQRHHVGRVEIVARQCQPTQHRHLVVVEVEECGGNGVCGRRNQRGDTRDGASGQLQCQEGVALRKIDDAVDDVGRSRHGRRRRHERGCLLALERSQIDLGRLAGSRKPPHSAAQDVARRARAVRQHGDQARRAGRAELKQHLDGRGVGEVCVIDHQRHAAGVARCLDNAPDGADDLVAREWSLQRCGRRRDLGQLGQHRAPAVTDGVEQRAVSGGDLVHDARKRCVGPPRLTRRDADHRPALGSGDPCHLPAEGGLPDPRRSPQREHLDPARRGPQQGAHARQLELATHEGGLGDPQPGDALVVNGLALGARRDTQLPTQRGPQSPVPLDRGGSAAALELAAHQLAVGPFVGRLYLQQALPLAAASEQLHIQRPQVRPWRLRPHLIRRVGKQVAPVGRGHGTGGLNAILQRRPGPRGEVAGIGLNRP